uniref:Uncharacterized protein n=1 Tax=Trichuris muris TaxID=70415 RepID=A0A5S6QLC2_TRIMR
MPTGRWPASSQFLLASLRPFLTSLLLRSSPMLSEARRLAPAQSARARDAASFKFSNCSADASRRGRGKKFSKATNGVAPSARGPAKNLHHNGRPRQLCKLCIALDSEARRQVGRRWRDAPRRGERAMGARSKGKLNVRGDRAPQYARTIWAPVDNVDGRPRCQSVVERIALAVRRPRRKRDAPSRQSERRQRLYANKWLFRGAARLDRTPTPTMN